MKVKDIKKFINQFNDDDNVLIECCIDEVAKKALIKMKLLIMILLKQNYVIMIQMMIVLN